MSDAAKSAQWTMTKTGWDLRTCDNTILATVRFAPWSGYVWRVGKQQGYAKTQRAAQYAARKALREAQHDPCSQSR